MHNERYSKQSAVTELDPVGKHNVGRKSSRVQDMIHVLYLPLVLNKILKIDKKITYVSQKLDNELVTNQQRTINQIDGVTMDGFLDSLTKTQLDHRWPLLVTANDYRCRLTLASA